MTRTRARTARARRKAAGRKPRDKAPRAAKAADRPRTPSATPGAAKAATRDDDTPGMALLTELNAARPRVATALPGPRARAMIERAKHFLSPSLIHVYPLMVKRAAGCIVEDVDGNLFLDAQAGVAAAATGHCHPALAAAIRAQATTLLHICGTDFHYPGYGQLCETLSELATELEATCGVPRTERQGWQTFLTNSGTEAVEAAMKLARHHTGRTAFIAFRGGFHGRTLGSLSLTASKSKYRRRFGPLLPGVFHVDYGDAAAIERDLFARLVAPDDVAAIVVEPVLGEGGYVVPPARFLHDLRALCDKHGILLVFDEVQSGMGRTGAMFAAAHFGVVPDALILAKGLASGMPLGALVARRRFMTWTAGTHGSTCGGNPVAIAAALATIDLLRGGLIENARVVGDLLRQRLTAAAPALKIVEGVRGLGLMIGVELRTAAQADAVARACYESGLLVLECGDKAIRLSPPLVMSREQAELVASLFVAACRKVAAA